MKLNPECVRDLLIDVEENTDIHHSIIYDLKSPTDGRLSRYSVCELEYHLEQCYLSGYFVGWIVYSGREVEVSYLSPTGHAFLDSIRSDNVWNRTKAVAAQLGTWSLDALGKIAVNVVSEIIKSHFK